MRLLDSLSSWLLLAIVVGTVAAWVVGRIREADANLSADIDHVLSYTPTDPECAVVVCPAPATGVVHGWATCDEHRVTA